MTTTRTRTTKTKTAAPVRVVPLLDFVPALSPRFMRPTHLAPIAARLERARIEPLRLVWSKPPRHSSTELYLHFIPWLLLHDPTCRIMFVSYGERLAQKKSRRARQLAQRAGVPLAPDAASKADWRTRVAPGEVEGGVWTTSPGGAITGEGFDVAIVDDAVRGRAFAESSLERDKLHDWFQSDLLSRAEPGASVIVSGTRWTPDDLSGRLIGQGWEALNLPAIADGRALWPERWPIGELIRIREEVGEYAWQSLYMGSPYARGGALFQGVHFYDELPLDVPLVYRIGVDLAYTTKTHADYSVAVVLASTREIQRGAPGVHFVCDVRRVQSTVPQFRATLDELQTRYPGARLTSYMSGTEKGAAQMLVESGIRLEVLNALTDKHTRAQPVSAAWCAGRVLVPRDASWLDPFVSELLSFTGLGDRHDDQVDALAGAYYSAAVRDPSRPRIIDLAAEASEMTPSQRGFAEHVAKTGHQVFTHEEREAFGFNERPRSRPAGDVVFRGQNIGGKAAY